MSEKSSNDFIHIKDLPKLYEDRDNAYRIEQMRKRLDDLSISPWVNMTSVRNPFSFGKYPAMVDITKGMT